VRKIHNLVVGALLTAGGVFGGIGQLVASEPDPVPVPPSVSVTPNAVPRPTTEPGVMDQADFPCQEDEALLYHPRFGSDRVGCVHLEEIRSTTW